MSWLWLHIRWRIAWLIFMPLGWIVWGCRQKGRSNTPKTGPVLICSNHQSFFDPLVVGVACYRPMHFFARRSLFRGLFGWAISLYQAFPVNRGAADPDAIKAALDLLSKGKMVLMFPEGTRTRTGKMSTVKRGVGMLAAKSGAPVLPFYIHGAFQIWPRSQKLPTFFKRVLRAYVGEPMTFEKVEGETKREFQERIAAEVDASMKSLEEQAYTELPLELPAAIDDTVASSNVARAGAGDGGEDSETEDGPGDPGE